MLGLQFDGLDDALQSLGAVMLKRGNTKEAIRLHLEAQTRLDKKLEGIEKLPPTVETALVLRSIKCIERLQRLYQPDQDETRSKQFTEKKINLYSRLPEEFYKSSRPQNWWEDLLPLEAEAQVSR